MDIDTFVCAISGLSGSIPNINTFYFSFQRESDVHQQLDNEFITHISHEINILMYLTVQY